MSSLSFRKAETKQHNQQVGYSLVPSLREVYAQRTALEQAADSLKQQGADSAIQARNPHRFSHLISIMPAGVLVIDQKGLVTLANNQASALLEEPLEGQLWRDVIGRAFSPKADDGHEVSMRNGKRVKIDISPLIEEKGQLIVITDLTETRQLQHRVSHMQRLSSLGNMVASLAHQVRTPLASAMLYAENIKGIQASDSTTARFSEKLLMRLKDLESQVNDMLLFAKSGDTQIVKAMSAKDIADASIQSVEAQFSEQGAALSFINNSDSLPLVCNLTALSGAIGNLMSNALQAMVNSQSEAKAVSLELNDIEVDGRSYVEFSVIDTGPGIPAELQQKIFEPFYTTKSQGTGLGLAVVQTVAKSHKGFVSCANRGDAEGATFKIAIPVNTAAADQDTKFSAEDLSKQTLSKETTQGVQA